jgi:DNA-binding response OmpR family regulator
MNDAPTTLLVAERDESIRAFLLDNLAADGYEPLSGQTEAETRVKFRNHGPALVVLGWLANERRPRSVVRAIRSGEAGGDPTIPVILLGEGADELELLRAFEAGCDDFMPKPFSYLEFRGRVRACLLRARGWQLPQRLTLGALVVDRDARKAVVSGRELRLSRLEFDLLAHLAAQPTGVFTKWELLQEVWGFKARGNTRTVDAHACRLRRKLARAGAPQLIHNARGVGYRLSLGSVPAPAEPRAVAVSGNGHAA